MINKILLQGRLTKDIELKRTPSDIAYTEFTTAWNNKYKDTEVKCFLRCKAWRQTAEFLSKYFQKGQELIIEGKMVTESWNGNDGQPSSRTICVVDKVDFCGKREENGGDGFKPVAIDDGDELPF